VVDLAGTIERHLRDEAVLRKSSKSHAARQVKLFAVREEILPLLDVARQTYRENDVDIQARKTHLGYANVSAFRPGGAGCRALVDGGWLPIRGG
jgi:hypothetical protein